MFRELAHIIIEAGHSKICMVSGRLRKESMLWVKSKDSLLAEYLLFLLRSVFFY